MLWLKWLALGLLGVFAVAVVVLVAGALLSLDWKRGHARAAAALRPLTDPGAQPDGLTSIRVGSLTFRARVANLAGGGEPMILLHGFPQTSASWQPLMSAAAALDYRVVAFDQRGYSPGARPNGVDAYTIDRMVGDVIGVADALGFDRFHLVGHDWGAAVGWSVAMAHPQRLYSWSALSIAHPFAFGEAVRSDPDQRKRSRYFLLFRTPWLPELLLGFNNRQLMRRSMYRWMPEHQASEYLAVFAEPGALTAALNWYRAMGRGSLGLQDPNVTTPVLFIWGNRDPAAGRKAVDLQEQYLDGPYEKLELDAGHWLIERRTETVVEAILGHVGGASSS